MNDHQRIVLRLEIKVTEIRCFRVGFWTLRGNYLRVAHTLRFKTGHLPPLPQHLHDRHQLYAPTTFVTGGIIALLSPLLLQSVLEFATHFRHDDQTFVRCRASIIEPSLKTGGRAATITRWTGGSYGTMRDLLLLPRRIGLIARLSRFPRMEY